MVLWKYTVREVRNRPGRAILTLLSIIISVAAVVAVTVSKATTHEACQIMYERVAGRAALEVAAIDDASFFSEPEAMACVQQVPGVKTAVPLIQKPHLIRFNQRSHGLMVMGINHRPENNEILKNYDLVEGNPERPFGDRYDALIEVGFAKGLGIKVGDEVKIMASARNAKFMNTLKIVGLVSPKGTANLDQAGLILIPLSTAQVFFPNVEHQINRLQLILDDNANEKVVKAEVAERLAEAAEAKKLPADLMVRQPVARSQLSKETIQSVELGLTFACVMMAGVAVIMIVNTFMMNVGERRRQLAILRAIGMTRRQLLRAMMFEAVAMGLVGTVIGSALGLGGAYLISFLMGRLYLTAMPPLQIHLGPFILATILGPSISLIAMFVPAYLAGKISPLEGMRFVVSERSSRITLRYALFTITLFAGTGSVLAACAMGYLPMEGMVYAGPLATLGFLAFIPILLAPMARLASFVMYPLLRIEGQIAQRQVLRRYVRTSLTISVLYVAVSTLISIGTTILDNVDDVHSWQARMFKGDYFIRSLMPDASSGFAPPMPESLRDEFAAVEGVANVESACFVNSVVEEPALKSADKIGIQVIIRDFLKRQELPMAINDGGDPAEVKAKLAKGDVVLGSVLASKLNLKAGDDITLLTPEGSTKFHIAGTANIWLRGGMIVYMEGPAARKLFHIDGVHWYIVHAKPGAVNLAYEKLKPICEEKGIMLHSFADLRNRVDSLINGVVAGLWGILTLVFLVGAFCIANTLTMNVLEQTRELALLRVVAMTRWQVRKTIFAQAAIIGFIGITIGIVGGLIGSYTSNFCCARLLGNAIALTFQPQLLAISFALGMLVVLGAALLPAERAARLNLLIALQYE